ncbi:MAG TPA: plastocyanin/azurin family copper-binding protein [Solirubrobacteraceae bacterium]
MHANAHRKLGLGGKLGVLAMAIAGTVALAACGSSNTAGTTATAGSSSQPSSPAQTTSGSTPAAQPTATTGSPAPSSSPAAGSSSAVALAANPGGELEYNTKQLTAKAGRVTIAMTNMSPVEHNVTVANGSTVVGATPTFRGGSKSLTLNLKPGTYKFYCSVPGHRAAGMEGTLTVTK